MTQVLIFTDKLNYIHADRDTIGILDKVIHFLLFINIYKTIDLNNTHIIIKQDIINHLIFNSNNFSI